MAILPKLEGLFARHFISRAKPALLKWLWPISSLKPPFWPRRSLTTPPWGSEGERSENLSAQALLTSSVKYSVSPRTWLKRISPQSEKLITFILIVAVIFLPAQTKVIAVDQIKTVEFYVYDSAAALSSSTSQTFSIYIGDDIGSVTNPIKSVSFTVSGTYTGNGSLNLTIDSGNSKTYTLPNVGSTPAPFEIEYKDTSNIINPTTAGSYSYSFGINPSGVTIYSFASKVSLTYKYAPLACADGQPTNEKIKTTQFYVAGYDTTVSSNTDVPFSVYIGDNISDVTNPIKSVYFRLTGTYTGNGSLGAELNSDAGTLRTYTLPNVASTPTSLDLLYKDTGNIINPTTAGNYSYTLNLLPSGVTIYSLGVVLSITYRYKPPTCGGLPATGLLTSAIFDTTGSADGPAYNSLLWQGSLEGGNGRVRFQLATSNCSNGASNYPTCNSGSWSYLGGATCSSGDCYDPGNPNTALELACAGANHNNQRYMRYKVQLCSNSDCSTAGSISPRVDDIVVNWSP